VIQTGSWPCILMKEDISLLENSVRLDIKSPTNAITDVFEGYVRHRLASGQNQLEQGESTTIFSEKLGTTYSDEAASNFFGTNVSISGNYAIVAGSVGGSIPYGVAYIFYKMGPEWVLQSILVASDVVEHNGFGRSVSISGDYAIVGAPDGPWESGKAYIFHRSGKEWTEQSILTSSDVQSDNSFGYRVSISGDYAIVGDNRFSGGTAHIFNRSGSEWTKQSILAPSDGAQSDGFGWDVSISGDYAVIASIGSYKTGEQINSGKVYVFHRSGSAWSEQSILIPFDGPTSKYFGLKVAISGEYVLIGAQSRAAEGNIRQGKVYVFHRSGAVWSQHAILRTSDRLENDGFGSSVSISGDYAIIGASEGKAYIFHRVGVEWKQQSIIITMERDKYDNFNVTVPVTPVAISGNDVIIGISGRNSWLGGAPGLQNAYIFHRDGAEWREDTVLTTSDGVAFDDFGSVVSIEGDYAIMGMCNRKIGENINQGAAYIFLRSGNTWTEQAVLTASDGAENNYFGVSVSMSEDCAIMGAHMDNTSGTLSRGKAYIFRKTGHGWIEESQLAAFDNFSSQIDFFGTSVSISGDYAVASIIVEDKHMFSAKAYVFHKNDSEWREESVLTPPSSYYSYNGLSVSLSGENVITGEYAGGGSAYIFQRSKKGWTERTRLVTSEILSDDFFGRNVSISGDYAIVGARNHDTDGNSNQGKAYVFHKGAFKWKEQAILTASDGGTGDYFGRCVAISGDYAIVGAPYNDSGRNVNQGRAYVFHRSGSKWKEQAILEASDQVEHGHFGRSVAISGDYAIIAGEQGKAYFFHRSGTIWTEQSMFTASSSPISVKSKR